MRVRDLAHKAGKAGTWKRYDTANGFDVYHYTTRMLSVEDYSIVYTNMGWGSVSDQNGMNQILRELGSSLYYSRKDHRIA